MISRIGENRHSTPELIRALCLLPFRREQKVAGTSSSEEDDTQPVLDAFGEATRRSSPAVTALGE